MSETAAIEHPTWLTSGDFTQADEPFRLFAAWFGEANRSEPADPNAMALATVDTEGMPNVRMVLMKGFDENGFVFYTNRNSQKGQELAANPRAGWVSTGSRSSVRCACAAPVVNGDAEADAYFASRPRGAQIGAWASQQSSPLESRFAFEKAVAVTPPSTRSDRCRDRHIGAATACPAGDRVLAGSAVPPA